MRSEILFSAVSGEFVLSMIIVVEVFSNNSLAIGVQ